MKIVLIGPVPPYRGGIAHFTLALAENLTSEGHMVRTISYRTQYPKWLYLGKSEKDYSQKITVEDVDFLFSPLNYLDWRKTMREIMSFQPDLVIYPWWVTFWAPATAGLIAWKLSHSWKEQFKLGKWGWLVLVILCLPLLTRFYIAYQNPYLAGDDALHHVLLTEITSTTGVLPYTLDPYGSTSLDHYHLGFYGLTAPLKLLANIASDQAVLWMSQFLSGLCGLGVFLVLGKKVSRPDAIIGMLAAGLLSPYPSWFINWSRFTQLAAQTILLPAVLVLWGSISDTNEEDTFLKRIIRSPIIESVLLISAICLTHFRVAGFMLPLILIICVCEIAIRPKSKKSRLTSLALTLLIGVLVFLVILPTLLLGLKAYLETRIPDNVVEPSGKKLEDASYYSIGDPDTMRIFKESGWLLITMAVGTLLGLFRSETRVLSISNLLWVVFLVFAAYAYKLNIYVLAFTNITTVVQAFYMPISIGTGLLIDSLFSFVPVEQSRKVENSLMVLAVVVTVVFVPIRIRDFEPHRAFMTAEDQKAMEWIRNNIPDDGFFAVNLSFLDPTTPFGTDAGYWLPYYAGRGTTTLTLISGLDGNDTSFVTRAWESKTIYENPVNIQVLCANEITYLYSGVKVPKDSPDFTDNIAGIPDANLIYDLDGVEIYQICER